ncbi:putative hemin transport protein [Devosia sp. YR412]|uniref:hemin-degrading factor n=1 Tax=Devosia sp. YR412 TaxID=1881030 RepID=UPI0008B20BAB|nr:ChuX/HutX family heme-like substrate-binding protein [Devosia sp. YR412]SEQ36989.1 putative hemin transport protein [Devosia sp. YR412]
MTETAAKTADDIRRLRAQHPEMRERDFARIHSISEAQLVAAEVGRSAIRLNPDVGVLLNGLTAVGEVMALTRNESAVHEKIGPYEKVVIGPMASMVLGEQIDLRIFPSRWAFGFAVEKAGEDGAVRHSLQFFDAQGHAVHKVHARPATNLEAWSLLVANLRHAEQTDTITTTPAAPVAALGEAADVAALREQWQALTDTHQFFGMLKKLNLHRLNALELVGEDLAWQLDATAVEQMFSAVAGSDLPIMVFVNNQGCVQIHAGPITTVKPMGPWLNVMDDTFHLHLRLDHIASVWAVRKPTSDGHITSVEVYDANRELIIQFFGKREEGNHERAAWRSAVEQLPLHNQSNAA